MKRKFVKKATLQKLLELAKQYPVAATGLAGAGIGAGVAGAASLTSEEKRKKMLRNMLLGATAGGTAGVAGRLSYDLLNQVKNNKIKQTVGPYIGDAVTAATAKPLKLPGKNQIIGTMRDAGSRFADLSATAGNNLDNAYTGIVQALMNGEGNNSAATTAKAAPSYRDRYFNLKPREIF